jgi:Flp pilus assembly protein TadG
MARQRGTASRRRERGSFSLELAVLAPTLLLVVSFIISVGRVTEGRAVVQGAARDAARAATINHNGANSARQAAEAAYQSATRGRDCDPLPPVDAPQPGGTVTVTVTCRVTTQWGKQTITRTAQSAVDIYRGTD